MFQRDNYTLNIEEHEVGPIVRLDLRSIDKPTLKQLVADCKEMKEEMVNRGHELLFAWTENPKIITLSKRTIGEPWEIQEPKIGLWVLTWDLEEI